LRAWVFFCEEMKDWKKAALAERCGLVQVVCYVSLAREVGDEMAISWAGLRMSYSSFVKVMSSGKAKGWLELMDAVLNTSPCEYQLLGWVFHW